MCLYQLCNLFLFYNFQLAIQHVHPVLVNHHLLVHLAWITKFCMKENVLINVLLCTMQVKGNVKVCDISDIDKCIYIYIYITSRAVYNSFLTHKEPKHGISLLMYHSREHLDLRTRFYSILYSAFFSMPFKLSFVCRKLRLRLHSLCINQSCNSTKFSSLPDRSMHWKMHERLLLEQQNL